MKLPEHFSTSEAGSLYRIVRVDGRFIFPVVRENYRYHHREIKTVADFKACLRAGPSAWPGGYTCFFITSDGAALSYAAARERFRSIAYAIRNLDDFGGWRVVGLECLANCDGPIYCDHTGREIE